MRKISYLIFLFIVSYRAQAQEIVLNKQASLSQAYLQDTESKGLLPMNDLNMESGYVLYETTISTSSVKPVLELENVRDYAAVFIDGKIQGTLTDGKKKLTLDTEAGEHKLELYVENIGRITYGPEILDNAKGLFGEITMDGEDLENWKIIPLEIRNLEVSKLTFEARQENASPSFFKGEFNVNPPGACYLNVSGWGMGEVWMNGKYVGAYWEAEKQQSIHIAADLLLKGKNEIVVFELKNLSQKTMQLTTQPVFK